MGNSKKFTIKYNGFKNHPNNVKIDLSMRKKPQKQHRNLTVSHSYDAIPTFEIPSMVIEEIMAEKVRAVVYSRSPRHLYDLNYLLDRQILLDPHMVRAKIRLYGEDFSIKRFRKSIEKMRNKWIRDLNPLLPWDPPPFEEISASVLERISTIMK